MAITIDLPPDEEQTLRRRAAEAGLDVETYLVGSAGLRPVLRAEGILSEEERRSLLDELADTAPPDAPPLSDYAVSRAGLYEDHD